MKYISAYSIYCSYIQQKMPDKQYNNNSNNFVVNTNNS